MSQPLVVLHEDPDCLAVVKPPGQFTQGTWAPPGEFTLEQDVRRHLNPEHPESAYLGMVHRLDRPTSGILLWAKSLKAARRLSSQFERRQVVKRYWAVVESAGEIETDPAHSPSGQFSEETIWSDWLTRPDRAGVVRAVSEGTPGARFAVTTVRRLQAVQLPVGSQWLELQPQTGRTHQLRGQAATRGIPIVGDATYGSTSQLFAPRPIIALHARLLTLKHPISHQELTLIAPVPAVWQECGLHLRDASALIE